MKSITNFVILCALICSAFAQSPTSECSEGIHPIEVVISDEFGDCTSTPCIVHPNQNIALSMKFTSPKYLDKIAPRVVANAAGLSFPFPLDQKDACMGITNTPCPIAKNEQVEYTLSIPLQNIQIPKIQLSLEFSLVETITTHINIGGFIVPIAKKKAVTCFLVYLKVE